ncbi:MAG: sugar phosphate nucleotidyltransferase [Candidatus Saganbacteria bacterium]|nr:sugar phosphate nucleotidyltransferase [Candidatus Saganbacteria bacterium]
MNELKAVLLAGGLGTRLHPLTCNIPKPMVPIVNRPIMAHVLNLLKKHGFTDVVVLLYHKADEIKDYFGDGLDLGVKITYLKADKDLGTAGAVKFAKDHLKDTFLVISADLITDINLNEAAAFHKEKNADLTIVLTRVKNPLEYGIVIADGNGKITQFLEKPSGGEIFSDTINSGIYIINEKVLGRIPEGREFDFSRDLFPGLLKDNVPLYGYISSGYWKDIGNLVEYGKANGEIFSRKVDVDIPGEQKLPGIYLGKNVKYTSSTKFIDMAVVGEGTFIADGAIVKRTIIGKNCEIGRGSELDECVIWDNVSIGTDAKLRRAIVGNNSVIGDRAKIQEGVTIGDDCRIEKDSVVKPYIKIWPKKLIEEGATVSRSMVWRERWTRGIFGAYGVTGTCNVEITPEFASALGAAFGFAMGKERYVAISRDNHKSSRMINRALVSGALSAGVNIYNLENAPIPVIRYELKTLCCAGGWHVRKSPYDPETIDIKFFDDSGMDLSKSSEKSVEKLFFGEDHEPVSINDTGELIYPFGVVREYKAGFSRNIDAKVIQDRKYKIVLDYQFGSASRIFPAILGELGCEVIALNANIDETKITKTKEEFERALNQMSNIVKSLNADAGIVFDTGAEKVFLVGDDGTIYSGDMALEIIVELFLRLYPRSTIAVPVTATRVIEGIAKSRKASVIRTKTAIRSMMEVGCEKNVSFVGENLGGFIFPGFQPAFDAMFSTIKILELLARANSSLSQVAKELPVTHIIKNDVSCKNEHKGKLIRQLIEEEKGKTELVDGVKIYYDDDWALILPVADRPIISIYVESSSMEKAQKLMNIYLGKVDKICGG